MNLLLSGGRLVMFGFSAQSSGRSGALMNRLKATCLSLVRVQPGQFDQSKYRRHGGQYGASMG